MSPCIIINLISERYSSCLEKIVIFLIVILVLPILIYVLFFYSIIPFYKDTKNGKWKRGKKILMTDDCCLLSLDRNKLLVGYNALAGGSSTPQQANACEEYCRARGRKISYGNARIPGQINRGSFSKRRLCICRGRKKNCRCAGRLRLKRAVWVRAPLRTSGARRRTVRGCRHCRETK